MFTKSFPRHSLKTRILLAIVALFVGGVWSLSFFISQMLRDSMQDQLGEQQRSTVAVRGDPDRQGIRRPRRDTRTNRQDD